MRNNKPPSPTQEEMYLTSFSCFYLWKIKYQKGKGGKGKGNNRQEVEGHWLLRY